MPPLIALTKRTFFMTKEVLFIVCCFPFGWLGLTGSIRTGYPDCLFSPRVRAENLRRFNADYAVYLKPTKMFTPFLV